MDPKAEITKLWKDLSESAREFAQFGLEAGSKALDFTAAQLKNVETQLKKTAERVAPKKAEETKADESEAAKQ